jgi:hypothetical protein
MVRVMADVSAVMPAAFTFHKGTGLDLGYGIKVASCVDAFMQSCA